MSKIIEFKKISKDKLIKRYELEDCDEDLIDLAEKLINCNPSKNADKKKDAIKAEYLKKAAEYRAKSMVLQELSDEELDAAAGGLLQPEDSIKNPLKE